MNYIMDNNDENKRLDIKTDLEILKEQVLWAGMKPDMKVADLGCGPGKTTAFFKTLSKEVTGFDFSEQRIEHADKNNSGEGISYILKDIREPFETRKCFDFVFIRFVLEFYKDTAFSIIENISTLLKPGGILFLADLDHNCLNHYGLSEDLDESIKGIIKSLSEKSGFDPYAGRKLYSYLYDLNFEEIKVDMKPHHLFYGDIEEKDAFNWKKKIEVAAKNSDFNFNKFKGGFEEFKELTNEFFSDRRRFTYTPIILCRGIKPK